VPVWHHIFGLKTWFTFAKRGFALFHVVWMTKKQVSETRFMSPKHSFHKARIQSFYDIWKPRFSL